MPRYDYRCTSCELVFEVKQSFSSEPVATCPDCMNGARRLIHSVPVVFKGSGFYVNDYGKGGSSGGSGPSPGPKEPESKKDGGPEVKAKAEAAPAAEGSKKESKAGA